MHSIEYATNLGIPRCTPFSRVVCILKNSVVKSEHMLNGNTYEPAHSVASVLCMIE